MKLGQQYLMIKWDHTFFVIRPGMVFEYVADEYGSDYHQFITKDIPGWKGDYAVFFTNEEIKQYLVPYGKKAKLLFL